MTLADLAQEEWAVSQTNLGSLEALHKALQAQGLPAPRIRIEAAAIHIVNHLVATSNLLGFGARSVLRTATPRYRFKVLNIVELSYARRSGVVYREGGYLSPVARRFIEILKRTALKLTPARP